VRDRERPVQHVARRRAVRRRQEPSHESGNVLGLQRSAGNAAVARLLSSDPGPRALPETPRVEIQAQIRRTDRPQRPELPSAAASVDRDAEEHVGAHETPDPAAVTAAFTVPAAELPEAADDQTVALPDVQSPPALDVADQDTIGASLTYAPTVTQSGAVSPFGATTWSNFNIKGTTVTAKKKKFSAKFTLENPITFNVASPKTSIASANDPALTNANYATAASDLTPDMSVQGGKPPRTQFWARDLTTRHEHFHAKERSKFGKAGAKQAEAWLNTQTASSVADVQQLIAQVPARVIQSSQAAAGTVDEKESRAYGDGAPKYKARAKAIKKKGDKGAKGGYP